MLTQNNMWLLWFCSDELQSHQNSQGGYIADILHGVIPTLNILWSGCQCIIYIWSLDDIIQLEEKQCRYSWMEMLNLSGYKDFDSFSPV